MLDLFRTLPGLVKEIEGADMIREALVFAAWRRIAGEGIVEQAVPVRLENFTLFVAVANQTWQWHLKDLAGQLLFKLNAAIGSPDVNFIKFEINERVVAASRLRPSTFDEAELRRDAEEAISPELEKAAASIEDNELRRQFLLAAGNCLVRKSRFESRA